MQNEQYHILVIDDNADILFMIKAMLEMRGYKITARESPENIESVMEAVQPDLVLMDMLLSGADGREVCRNFKVNKQFSQVPVIMISALPDAASSCIESGADYFLGKPFEMKDLFQTVQSALSTVAN
jgi:CheY-like chemotaxis protein